MGKVVTGVTRRTRRMEGGRSPMNRKMGSYQLPTLAHTQVLPMRAHTRRRPPTPSPASRQAADKVEAKERTVYIDYTAAEDGAEARKLTHEELVEKANVALQLMGIEVDDRPKGTTFKAVTKQRNGGLLYEMSTKEGAAWLKRPDVLPEFVRYYDDRARAKGAMFPYMCKFVPVAFQINNFDERRQVEEDSHLPRYTLEDLRWMRPVDQREPNQRVATLLINFPSAEAANLATDNELYIRGAKLAVEPNYPEPQRCHRCSLFAAHKASECKSIIKVCGKCRGDHNTRLCRVTNPADLYCVNCKVRGHRSIDRNCPSFWARKERMDTRNPATFFKYQVILNDPSTWVPAPKRKTRPPPPTASPPYPTGWQGPPDPRRYIGEPSPEVDDGWETVRRHRGASQQPGGAEGRSHNGRSTGTGSRNERGSHPTASTMRQSTLDGAFRQHSAQPSQGTTTGADE